jgi:hypothetical protein
MDKSFYTGFIRGSLEKPSTNELVVPYKGKAVSFFCDKNI